MTEVEDFARLGTLQYDFAQMTLDAHAAFLRAKGEIDRFPEPEAGEDDDDTSYRRHLHDEDLKPIQKSLFASAIQAVVLSTMCCEAAINDYGATYLGDGRFEDEFDRLRLIEKWEKLPKHIHGVEVRKDRAGFSSLKALIDVRNDLVHHKSERLHQPETPAFKEQIEELKSRERKLIAGVGHATKVLVLLSLEMEHLLQPVGSARNPLPTFDESRMMTLNLPEEVRPIVSECKRTFAKSIRG